MEVIPKKIHYCWFGNNPLNKKAIKCINSWKKYFPDYEIIQWNESNFDTNFCNYTKQAYLQKKWAFVSDVARIWILFNYGGLYFDTDVEVIKSMDYIIDDGPFIGCENEDNKEIELNPGLGIAAYPHMDIYEEILEYYKKANFLDENGYYTGITIVHVVTDLFVKYGMTNNSLNKRIANVKIYPKEYFCPLDYRIGKLCLTENTYSIHWYSASWQTNLMKFKGYIRKILHKIRINI